jgi:DnaK suppressor protein
MALRSPPTLLSQKIEKYREKELNNQERLHSWPWNSATLNFVDKRQKMGSLPSTHLSPTDETIKRRAGPDRFFLEESQMKSSKDKKTKVSKKKPARKAPKAPVKAAQVKSVRKGVNAKKMRNRQKPRPPEKPENLRETFIGSLIEKREELKAALDRLMNSRKEYDGQLTAGDFIDEVDDAQREISAYGHYSLIERKNRELQKIEYLINRITKEENGFGLCEECGLPIPKERLMVVPEATFCVPCQRELEKLDQKKAMASKASSGLGSPTRREVSFETAETAEEDDNLTVEYHIGTLPGGDMEETEIESPPEEKEEK